MCQKVRVRLMLLLNYWRNFATIVEMDHQTGINAIETTEPVEAKSFSIDGTLIEGKKKGVNIIKYNNGKTKKVLVK